MDTSRKYIEMCKTKEIDREEYNRTNCNRCEDCINE